MTKNEAIKEACEIVSLAYHSIGDYSRPCDCLCGDNLLSILSYQNDGQTLGFVRRAVLEKLERDGISVSTRFNSKGRLKA